MKLINDDCIKAIKEMPDNSVDSIVTDPPYELGFMGKSWDASGVAFNVEVWQEALRVLKPGGHLLAFSGSRTYHRMAVAIEDAGFEIRDQIMWVYGSGFPKSHNVSKGIDKASGFQGEVIGQGSSWNRPESVEGDTARMNVSPGDYDIKELSPAAKQWDGWGTALKPAHEPIVLARKPIIGTVANNVLTWGTGGLNIDASRVGFGNEDVNFSATQINIDAMGYHGAKNSHSTPTYKQEGRWPANFIHDGSDEVVMLFPDTGKSTGGRIGKKSMGDVTNVPAGQYEAGDPGYGDSGSAARFFYCAKASKRDRNERLEGFEEIQVTGGGGLTAELREDGTLETASAGGKYGSVKALKANHHPTVKPTDLMRYLVRLITPPNGTVLDPFMGSGSTGKACAYEGFDFIGIEQSAEYVEIARARIEFMNTAII